MAYDERERIERAYGRVAAVQALPAALGIHLGTLSIILPIGISFFTFEAISYTIDIYRGTFKPADQLRGIYEDEQGLAPDKNVIAYCRIGERSSHTWFVLTYLLGYPNVRNYDGSWTEWGNLVGVPIENPSKQV